jgi:hypothetical protein
MLVSKAASAMFTIEQINELHDRLGSAKTFTEAVTTGYPPTIPPPPHPDPKFFA